ncbi:MAG TPA: ATP synthase F1 subunit epsilon [Elusimicrobia bacterium]|nr:MAG: ATP synthase F1 subunit epsilon [Elusimicrobia bacterium RIFOXYA12_FULL_49_49]OGS08661.1 MAG: ATP synthase F1 subunit epsilon [Elusimicrobia bacterium RIFOXYA1_FULL_47_7]OGS11502.1 MAG: ATP synthase F1 subunit epsilon [Elusimicrobia bacterium RIFOXYB1_FULL_48_9]OGS16249.1 MAG: ATP synthase F1 subunit epsilon [Elusimicrobia bacterium RIFOXYA2_FULL_47_53]OGS26208.1 MAG: ATP synthase F1 subunit epsilon [Elusimicrobia bacterium RIFOXYB12_FULL_50_12]OGS31404.1 MAG: ATP synthase F1 subunit e
MANILTLEIITPEKIVFSGAVSSLVCPAENGELGILPGHADLLAHLRRGTVSVAEASGSARVFKIKSGVLEVKKGRVTVLTESVQI